MGSSASSGCCPTDCASPWFRTRRTQSTVVPAGGSSPPATEHAAVYGEVLIAVGHGRWSPSQARPSWAHSAPLVPAVFPVTRWLAADRVPPGAAVAVRGFALTFLDAALALTEGRGGAFAADARPNRLRYEASPDDAGVLLPFSRTGRPMLPKPEPEVARSVPQLEDIVALASSRVTALPTGFTLRDALLPILADCAAASLLAANRRPARAEQGSASPGPSDRGSTGPPAGVSRLPPRRRTPRWRRSMSAPA